MGYNFSAGPAVIPTSVRQAVAEHLGKPPADGISMLEASHRGVVYEAVHEEALELCRRLYAVPEDIDILLLQGGATLQFAMVPQNFIREGRSADYVITGSWAKKALAEAKILGVAHRVAGSSEDSGFRRVPQQQELDLDSAAEYVHITTNNTIYGTQMQTYPHAGAVPLAVDMSSDLLSRPVPWERVGVAYGGAQKNAGIAGLTIVFVRRSLLERERESTPTPLRYSTYASSNSLYNTPPVFAVYCFMHVLRWLEAEGGIQAISLRNNLKAELVYEALERSDGYYRGYAEPSSRSVMNVTFNLRDADLEARFCREAEEAGLIGLQGHRSVGGVRASLYNAMPEDGCRALVDFMERFAESHG